MVSICISVMTHDVVEHLFTCLCVILCLGGSNFVFFASVKKEIACLSCKNSLHWIGTPGWLTQLSIRLFEFHSGYDLTVMRLSHVMLCGM